MYHEKAAPFKAGTQEKKSIAIVLRWQGQIGFPFAP
jgi:hypothetical protein